MTFRLTVILFLHVLVLTSLLTWGLISQYGIFTNHAEVPTPEAFLISKIPIISLIFICGFIFLWLSLFLYLKNFTKAKQFLSRIFTLQGQKQKTATLSELAHSQNPYLVPLRASLTKLLRAKKISTDSSLKNIYFSDIVYQATQLNNKRYPSKIHLALEANIPLPVFSGSLFQALWELIKNANESTPKHLHKTQTAITIRTFKKENWFCCEVKDCGSGMDNSVVEQAFHPYFSTKENYIGMGLTLTQKTLSRIGGIVKIDSNKQGTTITLLIPLDYIEHVQTLKESSMSQRMVKEVASERF